MDCSDEGQVILSLGERKKVPIKKIYRNYKGTINKIQILNKPTWSGTKHVILR